jgi:hypothetical protein
VGTKQYTVVSAGGPGGHLRYPTFLSFATTDPATLAYHPPNSQTLTVNATGSGSITSDPAGIDCGSTCVHEFGSGTVVTLTATPASGYQFAGWSGACSGTGVCVLTLDAARQVSASFEAQSSSQVGLSIVKTGRGKVVSRPAGINCGRDCAQQYPVPKTVTLAATASPGYRFTGWDGACQGNSRLCKLAMTESREVIAHFTPVYRLKVSKRGTGLVSSDPTGLIKCGSKCSASVLESATITLNAVPGKHSQFAGWSGDCSGTASCTLTVTRRTTVSARFTRQP